LNIDDTGNIDIATIKSSLVIDSAATINLATSTGVAGKFVGIAQGDTYPTWTSPSLVPLTIVSNNVVGGTNLNITLTAADVGKYFTFDTSGAGGFIVVFNVDAFPANGTFYIKNVTPGFTDNISIAYLLGETQEDALVNNPLLAPTSTRNSALCVALWDTTNLYIL
jgi:hypothetical protein